MQKLETLEADLRRRFAAELADPATRDAAERKIELALQEARREAC